MLLKKYLFDLPRVSIEPPRVSIEPCR